VSTVLSRHYSPIRRIQAILFAGLFACVVVTVPSAARAQSRDAIAGDIAGFVAGAIIANLWP